MPNDAWAIYLRVSTEDSQTPERSFQMQMEAIRELLLEKTADRPLFRTYRDILTGTTVNRPEFQRMLLDAAAGNFSHLAVYRVDRFGRDTAEGLTVAKRLREMDIQLVPASNPNLDIRNPDGWMLFTILLGLGEHEVGVLRVRTRGGMKAKLESGHLPWRAPDGYKNVRRDISASKSESWVEVDPARAPIIQLAWELLLDEQHTLEDICEELDRRGYLRRSGKPFAWSTKRGKRRHAKTYLSNIFHNPYYAGWIVSAKLKISWGEVRSAAEALIEEDQWLQAQEILKGRLRSKTKSEHDYLLQGLLWLNVGDDEAYPLHCMHVTQKNLDYYWLAKERVGMETGLYLPSDEVEAQVPALLESIAVDEEYIPELQKRYTRNINVVLKEQRGQRLEHLERSLSETREAEKAYARLWAQGRLSDEAYDDLVAECHTRQNQIRNTLTNLRQTTEGHVRNLDHAVEIMARLPKAYATLGFEERQRLLRLIFRRITVGARGEVLATELHNPFAYLHQINQRLKNTRTSNPEKRVRGSRCVQYGTPVRT